MGVLGNADSENEISSAALEKAMETMKKIQTKQIVLKTTESILVVCFIIFEELVWNIFAKPVIQFFKRLRLFEELEKTFSEMNRYYVLAVFMLILVISEVMGLVSGVMIINGDLLFGLAVYAFKIPVAAFTFWLFDLTNAKLMTFSWFKSAYDYTMGLIDKLINSDVHQYLKVRMLVIKQRLRDLRQQYLQEPGFIDSIKSHYSHFRAALKLRLAKAPVSNQD